jgi:type IV pilus assembly protein PilB
VEYRSKQVAGRGEAVGASFDDIADNDADDATVVAEGFFQETSASRPSPPVGTDVDEAVGASFDDIADNDADDATVVAEGSFQETSASTPSPPVGTDVGKKTVITTSDHEKTLVQVSSTDAMPNVENGFVVSLESENIEELAATRGSLQADIDSKPLRTENQTSLPNAVSDGYVGVINKLLEAKLLNRQQAQGYISHAHDTGNTFFSELTKDRTGDENLIIYRWIANEIDCELIEDSSILEEMLPEPVEWLPPSIAERRNALIIQGDGDTSVKYGTTDPFNITTRDWIERRTGKKAEIVAVPPTTFREVIARLRSAEKSDEEMDQGVIDITFSTDQEQEFQDELDIQEVPRMVEYFLHKAYIQKASDIHVEPTESGLLVRNRVDGMLHDECQLPPSVRRAVASRIKILANMDVAERRRPQDGRISVIINKAPIDIRASVYPTVHGEKIVMRLLDQTSLSPSPNDLGMIEKDLNKLIDKINSPLGLILLCGPTGSGKTTTLYSCLGSIDRRTKNVLTCEDPVEYRLEGVHQMQVNEKIGVTFAAGLRTILRQDPDVIMVGECRDEETANMAIQASLTGHVVFSTIHANDAVGVVTRLLDMNIDPFLVSSAITLSIAQRLIRTVCRNCATQSVDGDEILRRLREDGVSDEKLENLGIKIDRDLEYVSPTGCHICRDTGYSGRRPVFEIFEMTNECRRMIMSNDFDPGELKRAARRAGMSTLVEHALTLIEDGITTHAEIIRVLGENDL